MNCAIVLWLWLGLVPIIHSSQPSTKACTFDVTIYVEQRVLVITGMSDVASFQLPVLFGYRRLQWTEHGRKAVLDDINYRGFT